MITKNETGASFTKQLSKNLGLSYFLSEKFTLIPYHKILSLNLRYFTKLAPNSFISIVLVCFFLTAHKFLSYINTGPYDFIHGTCGKLETSDKQNNAFRWTIQQHNQLYYRITITLASITFNHRLGHRASGSQILSRGSIKYTRITLYYSWYAMI